MIIDSEGVRSEADERRQGSWKYDSQYYVMWGRGCSGTCSYCSGGNWPKIYKDDQLVMPPRRLRDVHDVIDELKMAKENGFSRIGILDEFLVAPVDKLRLFFKLYRDQINLPFFSYLHPWIINKHPDIAELIISAGLDQSAIGIQTGCEQFAKDIYNRKNNHAQLLHLAHFLAQNNVRTYYHFIGANPLETDETFESTLQFAQKIPFHVDRDVFNFYYFTPFPKSPIVERFGFDKLLDRDSKKWLRQGHLLYLRLITDDVTFDKAKEIQDAADLQKLAYEIMKKNLDQNIQDVILRGKSFDATICYQALASHFEGEEVYIWGASSAYQNNKHLIDKCKIVACFDNNPDMHGDYLDQDILILSPDKLKEMPPRPLFIFSAYKNDIIKQIQEMGLKLIIP